MFRIVFVYIKALFLLALVFIAPFDLYAENYCVHVNGCDVLLNSVEEDGKTLYWFANIHYKKGRSIIVESDVDISSLKIKNRQDRVRIKYIRKNKIQIKTWGDNPIILEGKDLIPLYIFTHSIVKELGATIVLPQGVTNGLIELKHGDTLLFQEGAVLNGGITARGDNITIMGNGIIIGDGYERFSGPCASPISAYNCNNLTIKDIIITNTWSGAYLLSECNGILIENVKVCCGNMLNDDGIDVSNTSNVVIKNSFFRTHDDVFGVKGKRSSNNYPCENVLIKDCIVWVDGANVFRIGYESTCAYMKDIICDGLEVLHYSKYHRSPTHEWPHAIILIQSSNGILISNCSFRNIRITAQDDDMYLLIARPFYSKNPETGAQYTEAGDISDIIVENIEVIGEKNSFTGPVYIQRKEKNHSVKDVSLNNIIYFGKHITFDNNEN